MFLVEKKAGFFLPKKSIAEFSSDILGTCASQVSRSTCYDREIPKLMGRLTLEEAFAVTKAVQSRDSSYAFCHVLGHELSARETKKDPSKWKDVAARCPSGVCSNGCIHGAFQERFRSDAFTPSQIETIKPELVNVCEPREGWSPTKMEQATCYHGLGHLFMYITNANVALATRLCDELVVKYPCNDRKSTRLNSSHSDRSRMPSSA